MSMNLTIDDLKEIVRSLEKLDESGLEVTQIKVRNHHIHLRSVVPNTAEVVMTLPDHMQPAASYYAPHPDKRVDLRNIPTTHEALAKNTAAANVVLVQPDPNTPGVFVDTTPRRTWYVSGIAIASEQPSKPVYRQ